MQYLDELTEKERNLGFQLLEIETSEGTFRGSPAIIKAVIYLLGPADRIVKTYNEMSQRVEYHREVHGVYDPPIPGDIAKWRPYGMPRLDPVEAVSYEARHLDEIAMRNHPRKILQKSP